MQLEKLLSVNLCGVGMAEKLNLLQRQEEDVVGWVDGAGDAVDWMRHWYASA